MIGARSVLALLELPRVIDFPRNGRLLAQGHRKEEALDPQNGVCLGRVFARQLELAVSVHAMIFRPKTYW
jgi:hypothetical protein